MDAPLYIYTPQPSELPPPDRAAILRYAGVRGEADGELGRLLDGVLTEAEPIVAPRLCCRATPLHVRDGAVGLGFATSDAPMLFTRLLGCERAIVFVATVGLALDRLAARCAVRSPVRSLLVGAFGTERVEALCDHFCMRLHAAGLTVRERFSPGYGGVPLDVQRPLLAYLDAPRAVGVTLNGSLLMSPTKTVSAIVGIEADAPSLTSHE